MPMTPRSKLLKFVASGIAPALTAGFFLRRWHFVSTPEWAIVLAAVTLVALAAAATRMPPIFRHVTPNPDTAPPQRTVWVPEAPSDVMPRLGSRRWARLMFHNGIITIEELSGFYSQNHEDMTDVDR